ncbi:glycosyltransferase family 32 protein [Parabacteroides chinchillae]|uniref:Glycosyltransferase sugar-binding region containing DXD motif-containing protein n=1 Tax=Parabacteroides chinchillae TaxID=871327 RepID=A0A8G2F5E6_9BACT|nr:glycosyltransferase [Parabacteroides chinchillae]SEG23068.1 Glycosyltransferase sugar-binding region containing DXD motif-containing protein [Parabacteroides chinchillae]
MKIPKIIHQIYDNPAGVPDILSDVSESWKKEHPAWNYRLWDHEAIQKFLEDSCPEFIPIYKSFLCNKQRWEFMRYLILYHEGGLYVDMDYECIQPMDSLLETHSCCLALEPAEHAERFGKQELIGNAMLAAIPHHPFFEKIIEQIILSGNGRKQTMTWHDTQNAGIEMINNLYEGYDFKEEITLLPADLVTPLSAREISLLLLNRETPEMEDKVEKAFAVHYFLGQWRLKYASDMV